MSEGDTWSELQAHKKRQDSLRERIQRRKKGKQGILSAATEGIFVKYEFEVYSLKRLK